jgi:hypothetical protein
MTSNFFFTSLSLLLFLDPGSEIRDPGSWMGKIMIRDNYPESATLLTTYPVEKENRKVSQHSLPRVLEESLRDMFREAHVS